MSREVLLFHPDLGELPVDCEHGYVVTSLDIGPAEVRAVTRHRALADGVDDHTQYLGARAVTMTVRLMDKTFDRQLLIDALMAYQSPRRRYQMEWHVPGSSERRALTLSPRGAGVPISAPNFEQLAFQWVAPDGVIRSPEPLCIEINPATDVELGRAYPEVYPDGGRGPYPPMLALGERLLVNLGNEVADWRAQIYGPATNPEVRVNGVVMSFDTNGGVDLAAGESLVIDTKERTALLNGDPAQSRYDRSNFTAWSWQGMKLGPASNLVRVAADAGNPVMNFCFYHSWG